jgi:hypothetical protein
MDARRPVAAAALAAMAAGFALSPPVATSGAPSRAPSPPARSAGTSRAPSPPAIASADLVLRAGASKTILRVPRVGRWRATCSADRRVAIAFVADRLLPTADVVVSRTAGAPVGRRIDPGDRFAPDTALAVVSQHWQIAPFASAQVRVTAADVAGRAIDAGCAASVVAVTGPDQGPTREG